MFRIISSKKYQEYEILKKRAWMEERMLAWDENAWLKTKAILEKLGVQKDKIKSVKKGKKWCEIRELK